MVNYDKVRNRVRLHRRASGSVPNLEHCQLYRETLRADLVRLIARAAPESDPDIGCYYGGWSIEEIKYLLILLDRHFNCYPKN